MSIEEKKDVETGRKFQTVLHRSTRKMASSFQSRLESWDAQAVGCYPCTSEQFEEPAMAKCRKSYDLEGPGFQSPRIPTILLLGSYLFSKKVLLEDFGWPCSSIRETR